MLMKILLTKNLLPRTKNHTIMLNCGAPGCTNWSTTHPEKCFHRLPSISKKKKKKKEWTHGWQKLIKIYSKRIIYLLRPLWSWMF